jgi:NADP-dependent 3-hydroxy acid dehydrogenase YdfG
MKIESGQVAVVTGAASGIGLALCEALAARGARLAMADLAEDLLREAVDRLGATTAAIACRCDVANGDDVAALRRAALDAFGRIDLVFNNAGVVLAFKPMWEHAAEDWDWLMGVNLGGVINGIRTFVPDLVRQNSGHIINTASMAGVSILPFNGVYNASKHAVVSLTETLAAELAQRAPGVHATVVCPGLVPTRVKARGTPDPMLTRDNVASGAQNFTITAEQAASEILAAIEADQVYVFTNQGARERIEERFNCIRNALEPGCAGGARPASPGN